MYVCKRTSMVTWAHLRDGHELIFLHITQLNAPAYRLTRTQTIVPAQGPTRGVHHTGQMTHVVSLKFPEKEKNLVYKILFFMSKMLYSSPSIIIPKHFPWVTLLFHVGLFSFLLFICIVFLPLVHHMFSKVVTRLRFANRY